MKRRLLALLLTVCLVCSMAPAALAANGDFTDVKTADWFAKEVAYVFDNGLMNGVGDNQFVPNGNVSRAMTWTTLARVAGVNTAGSDPWWQAGRLWTMVNGISDGTQENANITREQLVTMMYRYAQMKGYDVTVDNTKVLQSFADAKNVSDWAVTAMQWACCEGLMNGIGGKLEPQGNASRAQLAVMLCRFVEDVLPNAVPPTPEVPATPEEPTKPSSPARPSRPSHTHRYSYEANYDGTHQKKCSCGTVTEACGDWIEGSICEHCGYNKDAVARIDETYYSTLEDAMAVGGDIILLTDYEITASIKVINTVTLDLNGSTLTGPDDGQANWYAFIVDGGNLTLKDTDGNGELYAKCYGVETKSGSFTMESGKITATKNTTIGTAIVNYGGTVTIEGGEISGVNYAISTAGYFDDAATFIEDGTITGEVGMWDYENEYTQSVTSVSNTYEIAVDYAWVKTDEVYVLTAGNYVAQIGQTKYEALEEAMVVGGHVTLLTDYEIKASIKVTNTATLDLNGNTLTGPDDGQANWYAFIVDGGNLTLKDTDGSGELYAKCYGVETKSGSFTMESGKITATKNTTIGTAIVNYGGTVTIEGGEISGVNYAISTAGYFDDAATFIEDGTITGEVGMWDYENEYTQSVTSVSNTYEIAVDYAWVKTDEVYVLTAGDYVAQIGQTKYETLEEAMAVGGDVTLLTDYEIKASIKVTNTATLDLNGNTLTGPDDGQANWYAFIVDGGNLTLKDTDGSGELYAKCYGVETKSGSFTMESGKITATQNKTVGTAIVNYGGTVVIKDGIMAGADQAVFTAGYFSNAATSITGGTITDEVVIGNYEDKGFTESVTSTSNAYAVEVGYAWVEIGEIYALLSSEYVAMVGEEMFETLEAAMAVGGDIILLTDYEIKASIKVENTVTLDLNGNTLTGPDDGQANWYAFIVDGGNLTLKDTDGNGELYAKCYGVETKSGSFTMEGGKITATKNATIGTAIVNYGGTVIIEGGEISGVNYAISTAGYFDDAETFIEDGTITGEVGMWDYENEYTQSVTSVSNTYEIAVDYAWVKTDEVYVLTAGNYVAQIGQTKYETLEEAMVVGGDVTLLTDYEVTASIKVTNTATLDLNGNTLTGPDDGQANWYAFIVDGGDLTLKDTDGSGELYAKCYGVETKSGSFTMESGTITATQNKTVGTAIVNYGGTVVIQGGIMAGADQAVFTAGYFSNAATSITGGTITGEAVLGNYDDKDFTESVTSTSNAYAVEEGYAWVESGDGYELLILE